MRKLTSIVLVTCLILIATTVVAMEFRMGGGPPRMQRIGVEDGAPAIMMPPGGHSFFPKELHEIVGYTFLTAGLIHFVLNFQIILSYLGLRRQSPAVAKRELLSYGS